jgi:hypothetical protein
MKKMITMLVLAGMIFTGTAQTKTGTAAAKSPIPVGANNQKHLKMKDYIFILWLKPVTPDVIAQVGPKWSKLIPQWIKEGHLLSTSTMVNEGTLIQGKNRVVSHKPVNNKGEIVLDVLRIKAKDMAQALELARQCPTLDVGGSVEVREGLVLPGSANNN